MKDQLEKLKQTLLALQDTLRAKKPTTLYEAGMAYIGVDASPNDLAPDELGCAESVSSIIKKIIPDFPIITGTFLLFHELENNPRFKKVTIPMPGTIILSPTGLAKKKTSMKHGHVGIFGIRHTIMSNDSRTGKWMITHTLTSWDEYYGKKGGYPILFYELIK